MTRFVFVGLCASVGLAAGLTLASPSGTNAHQPEPLEASERLGAADDLFLPAPDGWRTYVNGRFGMQVSYPPDLFTPAAAPEEGDGRRFEGEDAVIEVIGWENENELTPEALASHLVGAEGYGTIVHREIEEARLVLSGRRAEQIFLEEYVFEDGTVQAFAMEYPSARRATYDPLLETIAESFISGEEAASGALAAGPRQHECPVAYGCPPPAQFHAHHPAPPLAVPHDSFRILVWAKKAPGGKKLKMKGGRGPELKSMRGRGRPEIRGLGLPKPKAKKAGRKKPKGKGRGKGKKR